LLFVIGALANAAIVLTARSISAELADANQPENDVIQNQR
jgi:hypothetical protein